MRLWRALHLLLPIAFPSHSNIIRAFKTFSKWLRTRMLYTYSQTSHLCPLPSWQTHQAYKWIINKGIPASPLHLWLLVTIWISHPLRKSQATKLLVGSKFAVSVLSYWPPFHLKSQVTCTKLQFFVNTVLKDDSGRRWGFGSSAVVISPRQKCWSIISGSRKQNLRIGIMA